MKYIVITFALLSWIQSSHAQSYRYMLNPNVITLDTLQKSASQAFSSQQAQLPFFCRIEKMADTKSDIKFRFRLGDILYVDQLEQKNTDLTFQK